MFRVGFVIPKPLSPKHRSTFLPLQHAATLILSVDWGLGKSASSNIVLDNPYVSRRHARIVVRRGHFEIEDLGSKNGTSVNGTLLGNRRVRLRYGDRIELGQGQVILKFQHLDSTLTLPAGSRNAAEALVVDAKSRDVWIRGNRVDPPLSRKEFDILTLLYDRRGEACSKDEIADRGWP